MAHDGSTTWHPYQAIPSTTWPAAGRPDVWRSYKRSNSLNDYIRQLCWQKKPLGIMLFDGRNAEYHRAYMSLMIWILCGTESHIGVIQVAGPYLFHCTWWQHHTDILTKPSPAPPDQLPVGLMSIDATREAIVWMITSESIHIIRQLCWQKKPLGIMLFPVTPSSCKCHRAALVCFSVNSNVTVVLNDCFCVGAVFQSHEKEFTHCDLGNVVVILQIHFSKSFRENSSLATHCQLLSGEFSRTSLVRSPLWFK